MKIWMAMSLRYKHVQCEIAVSSPFDRAGYEKTTSIELKIC